jgi:DNA gyrase subunit B
MLCDCVSKNSSQTELLVVVSGAAYEAAKIDRDRMTQAILPIDQLYKFEEDLIDVLSNDVCMSLFAALGVGIVFGGNHVSSERTFDITKLRYGKIIVVREEGILGRRASNEVLRFLFRYMRPLIDGGHTFVPETPLKTAFRQNDFVEHILNSVTRRLRIISTEDDLESPLEMSD